jgi:hypothetical protein
VRGLQQQQTRLGCQEAAQSPASSGTMRLGKNTQTASAGYAVVPNSNRSNRGFDIWIANTSDTATKAGTASASPSRKRQTLGSPS